MTDAKLRDLERRWKETGDVHAEAMYLLERTRAGEIGQDRLGMAAELGHPAAQLAVGAVRGAEDWVATVVNADPRLRVELLAAACALAFPVWERFGPPSDRSPQRAIARLREWVQCPCDTHLAAAEKVSAKVRPSPIRNTFPSSAVALAVFETTRAATAPENGRRAVDALLSALAGSDGRTFLNPERTVHLSAEFEQARRQSEVALRNDLIRFLLRLT